MVVIILQRRPRMLFRKDIARCCSHCLHAAVSEDKIICAKVGVVSPDHRCWRYRYDPCKRIPPKMKALDVEKFNDADFSL